MTNHSITFDCAPGVHEDIPEHRVWRVIVPESELLARLEAFRMLDKNVLSVDIVSEN